MRTSRAYRLTLWVIGACITLTVGVVAKPVSAAPIVLDFEAEAPRTIPAGSLTLSSGGVDVTFTSGAGLSIVSFAGRVLLLSGTSQPLGGEAIIMSFEPAFRADFVTAGNLLNDQQGQFAIDGIVAHAQDSNGNTLDIAQGTGPVITVDGAGIDIATVIYDDLTSPPASGGFSLDSITFEGQFIGQVPYPSVLWLLAAGLGLGGVAAARQRLGVGRAATDRGTSA